MICNEDILSLWIYFENKYLEEISHLSPQKSPFLAKFLLWIAFIPHINSMTPCPDLFCKHTLINIQRVYIKQCYTEKISKRSSGLNEHQVSYPIFLPTFHFGSEFSKWLATYSIRFCQPINNMSSFTQIITGTQWDKKDFRQKGKKNMKTPEEFPFLSRGWEKFDYYWVQSTKFNVCHIFLTLRTVLSIHTNNLKIPVLQQFKL